MEQIPPEAFVGPAVVVDLRHMLGENPIQRQDIEKWENDTGETIQEGDVVLIMSDFSKYWKVGPESDVFMKSRWPYMTKSSADYLLSKKIRLIGVESFDIDIVDPYGDLTKEEFIGHKTFLPNGIYVVENLTNLDQIQSNRCFLITTPLKMKGGSGSNLRAIAIV